MIECEHPNGYVVSDTGKDMKCFRCGHVREIVAISAHYHNSGFRLSRTKKSTHRYEYALTRFGLPVEYRAWTPNGTILRTAVPKSERDAYSIMNTILDDERRC